jgi:hypothetical protein
MIALLIVSFFMKSDSFLFLSISQTTLIILYLSGYWEFFGFRFRMIYSAICEIAIIAGLIYKINESPLNFNILVTSGLIIVQVYLIFQLIKILIAIFERAQKSYEIEFPLKNGLYLVTDGGNSKISRLMNYHFYSPTHKKNNTNNSMLYATDIVKLSDDNQSFLPKTNNEYPIFNEEIYSPIDGIIEKVVNNIDDNAPFAGNYPYNTGNTVVIKKDNHYLLLGHLKKDSVKVKVGEFIQRNDLLGLAGNSGWTERPHLHMQLIESESENYWKGVGLCMKFRNKNLYKNRKIKMHAA